MQTFRSLPVYPSVIFASSLKSSPSSTFSFAKRVLKIIALFSTDGNPTMILFTKVLIVIGNNDTLKKFPIQEYVSVGSYTPKRLHTDKLNHWSWYYFHWEIKYGEFFFFLVSIGNMLHTYVHMHVHRYLRACGVIYLTLQSSNNVVRVLLIMCSD